MIHFVKNVLCLSRDLVVSVRPEQILQGKKMFRPFRKFQDAWINYIYPGDSIRNDVSVWSYLQKYMMPMIKNHASHYHVQGIQLLGLESEDQPNFDTFQRRFRDVANGFQIEPVANEIAPREYFQLISEQRFPCVARLREHDELFCGNEPDFWHEAIGHIAPLCFPEVQRFYLQIADYMLATRSDTQFDEQLAVAWTLMEYGFLKLNGNPKMFGAALVGSHLANMRYLRGVLAIEPADRRKILGSGFFSEEAPMPIDAAEKIRFFCMDRLDADRFF
jgi:phenylalanine-4-hydroxylase